MPTVSHELATAWPSRAGTCMLVLFQEDTKDGRFSDRPNFLRSNTVQCSLL